MKRTFKIINSEAMNVSAVVRNESNNVKPDLNNASEFKIMKSKKENPLVKKLDRLVESKNGQLAISTIQPQLEQKKDTGDEKRAPLDEDLLLSQDHVLAQLREIKQYQNTCAFGDESLRIIREIEAIKLHELRSLIVDAEKNLDKNFHERNQPVFNSKIDYRYWKRTQLVRSHHLVNKDLIHLSSRADKIEFLFGIRKKDSLFLYISNKYLGFDPRDFLKGSIVGEYYKVLLNDVLNLESKPDYLYSKDNFVSLEYYPYKHAPKMKILQSESLENDDNLKSVFLRILHE